MSIAIIVFPGSNCDRDLQRAVKKTLGIDCDMIWHDEAQLPDNIRLVFLPGGFSYGDYIRSGIIAAHARIMQDVYRKIQNRTIHVIGICNGFQILTECKLLPGALLHNISLRFRCRLVSLNIANHKTIITSAFDTKECRLPIAHVDGNYYASSDTLKSLQDKDNIIFRYCDNENPNGSLDNIAGIMNDNRNVFGLMPHPERAVETRYGNSDGVAFFSSMLEVVG